MQNIYLTNFKSDIDGVREYINHIHLVNEIERNNRDSTNILLINLSKHLHSFGTSKKTFEYKSIIVSLYGVLEKHINIWIHEHIESLPSFYPKYEQFSEEFQKQHFDLSIRLISKISENKYSKYEHLKKEEVLTSLNSCIINNDFKLNADAFLPFSGNLKHSKIVDAFKPLGINLESKLNKNTEFSNFLKLKYGTENSIPKRNFYLNIDDLVSRRNDIAHGVEIDSILNVVEFEDYMEFLEHYGKAIFEIIIEKEIMHESLYLYKKIEKIKGVFKKGSILCFEIQDCNIKVGDFIILKTSDDEFMKKEILEIRIKNESFQQLSINDKTDIGVNLVDGITKKQQFYIKNNVIQ
jgi:hypothetical protein